MSRGALLALFVLSGSGCFNFNERLLSCRDDLGRWTCGDAGTTPPDGGLPAIALPDRSGLVCQQGWCWEHPRPAGHELRSIWGRSRDDFWVGGTGGLLAHWDGTSWTNLPLERDLRVTALCGHEGDVYAGMGTFGSGTSTERLLRYRGGTWTKVDAALDDVTGLSCDARLLISHYGGLAAASWTDPRPMPVWATSGQMEVCNAVLETGPNDCLVSSHDNGGETFTRIRGCDGGVEWENSVTRIEGMWLGESGETFAAISGAWNVLHRRTTGWWPVFTGSATEYVIAGIPFPGGSLAVGPWGTVVQFAGTDGTPTLIETKRNDALYAVFSPPGGAPIAVGEWGCITELTDAGWTLQNDCAAEFVDVSFGRRLLALTDEHVWERRPERWARLQPVANPRRGLREQADGGLLFLADSVLEMGALQVPLDVTDAESFELVSDTLAVVVTASGQVIEVTLPGGGKRVVVPSGAVGPAVVDEQGTAWVRGTEGTVFASRPGESWVTEEVSSLGPLTDLAVGFGKVWTLRDSKVFWRSTTSPGWTSIDARAPFTRLVPVSAEEVLVISGVASAKRLTLTGNQLDAAPPPSALSGPLVSKGGEAWGLTAGGEFVRFKP